jgi:hypothetical protein
MMDFSPYAEFFAGEWERLLFGVKADWSWDRKACYLYLTATQGNENMAAKRGRKPAQNQTAALLVAALDYLSIVPDKAASPNVIIINGPLVTVNNGLLKAGIMIGGEFPADVVAKINLSALRGALARVGKEMEIAFTDESISIEAGDFNADLTNEPIDMANDRVIPDPMIAPLNNAFRDAVVKVGRLASDTGEEVMTASIALLGGTVMATKRHTILEAWHGNDMPSGIYVPKAFVTALGKAKFDLVGFGFSNTTFTVHFSGGVFLQTNTYPNAWEIEGQQPGYALTIAYRLMEDAEGSRLLDPGKMADDFKAIMAVTDADLAVMLGKIISVDGQASLDAKEMMEAFVIDPMRYVAIADLIKQAKVVKSQNPWTIRFWGDLVRGVLIIDEVVHEAAPNYPAATPAGGPAWGSAPDAPARARVPPENPTNGAASGLATSMAPAPNAAPIAGNPAASVTPAPIAPPSNPQSAGWGTPASGAGGLTPANTDGAGNGQPATIGASPSSFTPPGAPFSSSQGTLFGDDDD